jgi:hypothetical protein
LSGDRRWECACVVDSPLIFGEGVQGGALRNRSDAINFFLTVGRLLLYGAGMGNELSTSQVAGRLGVSAITVRLWCRRGLFKNARELETPRGPVWMIPEGDLVGFRQPKMGRPKKLATPLVEDSKEKAA